MTTFPRGAPDKCRKRVVYVLRCKARILRPTQSTASANPQEQATPSRPGYAIHGGVGRRFATLSKSRPSASSSQPLTSGSDIYAVAGPSDHRCVISVCRCRGTVHCLTTDWWRQRLARISCKHLDPAFDRLYGGMVSIFCPRSSLCSSRCSRRPYCWRSDEIMMKLVHREASIG
jgi:hypothetical protein